MNPIITCLYFLLTTAALISRAAEAVKPDPRLIGYLKVKESHARSLTNSLHLEVSQDVWDFFRAGRTADWDEFLNLYGSLRGRSGQYTGTSAPKDVCNPVWQTVNESYGAFAAFKGLDSGILDSYCKTLTRGIPKGAIYFGGTDPGRWLISAAILDHPKGKPFIVLTQNALADGNYQEYIRTTFGRDISLPSQMEIDQMYEDYKKEALQRKNEGKLKPDEMVMEVEGKIEVSGKTAVMAVNGLIARAIFDKNPNREFFIEESFLLEWMSPYLIPHGLIFKINRKPLDHLSSKILPDDSRFWGAECARWIGDWVKPKTKVSDICEFAERIYGAHDLSGFTGSRAFVNAGRDYSPQHIYGKMRAAQAALLTWRAANATTDGEKRLLNNAAEFAWKQAFALGPFSIEAVLGYLNYLISEKRLEEGHLVMNTAQRLGAGGAALSKLAESLWPESEPLH